MVVPIGDARAGDVTLWRRNVTLRRYGVVASCVRVNALYRPQFCKVISR